MTHRVLLEFGVDVPNADVARDVETRLTREQHEHLRKVLAAVMGHDPLRAPGQPGFLVSLEPVTWDPKEQDWFSADEKASEREDNEDMDDE